MSNWTAIRGPIRLILATTIAAALLLLTSGSGCGTSNTPPGQPGNLSPTDNAAAVSLTPTLQSSDFSDSDSGDTHAASQLRIATVSGDYGSPVFDSRTDGVNLTQMVVEPGALRENTTYYWQVRYQDAKGAWSDWSTETSFTTVPNRIAVLETSLGTIKFKLYEDKAPITTTNFVKLAESGFYDGLIFHRVVDNFVIQTGDPRGTGMGGSAQTIPLEAVEGLTHTDGAVGMARSQDPNSATSQFYICDGPQHNLDGNYAVFGQVIEGMDVVRATASVKVDAQKKPLENVTVTRVYIE